MLFKISNSFFYTQKWPILCLRIPVLQLKQVILITQPWPTYAVLPTKPDQNMTNLRCTADHHTVPPLNIRPVESGIIPNHFNRLKNLSRSPRPLRAGPTNPRCILDQHTLSPIKACSLPIRPFFQSRGWSGLWCEPAFRWCDGSENKSCQKTTTLARRQPSLNSIQG